MNPETLGKNPENKLGVEEGEIFFKYLRLISPETAQGWGIPTEAPIFVSPNISNAERCQKCSQVYGPIIYQPGTTGIIEGHHFHRTSGGVYYLKSETGRFPQVFFDEHYLKNNPNGIFPGWVAIVEPVDRIKKESILTNWAHLARSATPPLRSPRVRVRQILAFCMESNEWVCSGYSLQGPSALSEGWVFSLNSEGNQFLYPLCRHHALDAEHQAPIKREFAFKATDDGEIFFSRS